MFARLAKYPFVSKKILSILYRKLASSSSSQNYVRISGDKPARCCFCPFPETKMHVPPSSHEFISPSIYCVILRCTCLSWRNWERDVFLFIQQGTTDSIGRAIVNMGGSGRGGKHRVIFKVISKAAMLVERW